MGRFARTGLDSEPIGTELGCIGLIIEPIVLLRNQETYVSIPGLPPPLLAITYMLIYKGNYVYRVESAERLSILPINEDGPAYMLGTLPHLIDAIESLGVEQGRTWIGYCVPMNDLTSRVVAWAM